MLITGTSFLSLPSIRCKFATLIRPTEANVCIVHINLNLNLQIRPRPRPIRPTLPLRLFGALGPDAYFFVF